MTHQEFREEEIKKQDEQTNSIRPVVTEHFEALCRIAAVIQVNGESIRVETPYAEIIFHPKAN